MNKPLVKIIQFLVNPHLIINCVLLVLCWSPIYTRAEVISDLLAGEKPSYQASASEKVISVDHSKQNDTKIAKRLKMIYSELDALTGIKVSVSNGIATLEGDVESKASAEKAVHFANQVEDVIEVKNKLVVKHRLQKRLQSTLDKLILSGEQLIAALPVFIVAAIVFYLFWTLGSWIANRKNLFRQMTAHYFIADLLGKGVHGAFVLIGLVLALNVMDATALVGTILGAAGILGIAFGIAVRDTVENFIATILLSIRNPFSVNDFVDIDGRQGNILRLTSRATVLISPDGNHIRIPNSAVYKAVIVNYSRKPERRFEFSVGVGFNEDLSQVQAVIHHALQGMNSILPEPKPLAVINKLADSSIEVNVYAWVNQNDHSFIKVRSEAIKTVKEALDTAEISMPSPIYDLLIKGESPLFIRSGSGQEVPSLPSEPPEKSKADGLSFTIKETDDTEVDLSVIKEIEQENFKQNNENLLSKESPSEL